VRQLPAAGNVAKPIWILRLTKNPEFYPQISQGDADFSICENL
jgi:hypothetical protein